MDPKTKSKVDFRFFLFGFSLSLVLLGNPHFPSRDEAFKLAQGTLKSVRGDYQKRFARRIGNQTLQLEAFIVQTGNLDHFETISRDTARYRDWVLNGINQKPTGGEYLIQIVDVRSSGNEVEFVFKPNLPLLNQRTYHRRFQVNITRDGEMLLVGGDSTGGDSSLLDWAKARLYVFPAPGQKDGLWIYLRGYAAIKSWILYEALPEKLLVSESGDRIQTLLNNYTDEEIRQIESKPQRKKGKAG